MNKAYQTPPVDPSKPQPNKQVKGIPLKKPLTVANIQNQKIKRVPFTGEWYQAFKKPQNKGVWFVWGGSASGKSTFVMQLAKELAKSFKTTYNLLEEETDDSDYIDRTALCNMGEVKDNFHTVSYGYEELMAYLGKRNAPKVVVIDSITYFTRDFSQYLVMKRTYPNTIFVIVGHADGKNPRSKIEEDIMYDAKMKIFVSGYLAICKGRTIGPNGGRFITWEEGYNKIQGTN